MFFESWWQGIVFGVVTTVGMLAICSAYAIKWKKYVGDDNNNSHPSCDAHH